MAKLPNLWRKVEEAYQIVEADKFVYSFKIQRSYLPLIKITAVIITIAVASNIHVILAMCQTLC